MAPERDTMQLPKLPDFMKHFKDEPPAWKLAALIVCMSPLILYALKELVKALK
jgi:hypothetical protein